MACAAIMPLALLSDRSNKHIHELVFGILLDGVLLFPLAGKQGHRAVMFVFHENGVSDV